MAGINPNLGKMNLQHVQLNATAKVNAQKTEDKENGDAKKSAVWNGVWMNPSGTILLGFKDPNRPYKIGDKVILDGKVYEILSLKVDEIGGIDCVVKESKLLPSDYEDGIGDY